MRPHNLKDLTGFAVDLGGTKLAAAAFENGEIQRTLIHQTKGQAGSTLLIKELAQILHDVGFQADQPIGVAVAGKVDALGRWSAVNKRILKDLDDVPLSMLLEQELGAPVLSLNDTQAAAIGEYRYGAGVGSGALAYLTVSTGISAGFVLNGMPLHSPNGMLGHIGFSTSRYGAARACGSERLGTFESLASGRAIEARALSLGHEEMSAQDIFAAARSGCTWAKELIDDSSAAIAELCANLAATLGIERVVLGGGVGLAQGYLDQVKGSLQHEPDSFRPQIIPTQLGKNSALYGVLSAAVDKRITHESSDFQE